MNIKIVSILMVLIAIIGLTGIGMATSDHSNKECKQECREEFRICKQECDDKYCKQECRENRQNCLENCECEEPEIPEEPEIIIEEHKTTPLFILGMRIGAEQLRIDLGLSDKELQDFSLFRKNHIFMKGFERGYDKAEKLNS